MIQQPRGQLTPVYEKQFRKDFKKLPKHHVGLVEEALRLLIRQVSLPGRFRDKALHGEWRAYREIHPGPDLIVIYQRNRTDIVFARVGSHTELYG